MSGVVAAVDHASGTITVSAAPPAPSDAIDYSQPFAVRFGRRGEANYAVAEDGYAIAMYLHAAQRLQVDIAATTGFAELVPYARVPLHLQIPELRRG